MDKDFKTAVRLALKRFMARNYREDVSRLNNVLARGSGGAGLEGMPPVTHTGDLFGLAPGRCVAMLGINPARNCRAQGAVEYPELVTAVERVLAGDDAGFDMYLAQRARYFRDDSLYYGTYFTRIGNGIGIEWFGAQVRSKKSAMATLQRHVFKADVFPWFSRDTALFDTGKLPTVMRTDAAASEYAGLLGMMLRLTSPRWIQCHGEHARKVVEALYCPDGLVKLANVGTKIRPTYCGWAVLDESADGHDEIQIPVLAHSFMNRLSAAEFSSIATQWNQWRERNGCVVTGP